MISDEKIEDMAKEYSSSTFVTKENEYTFFRKELIDLCQKDWKSGFKKSQELNEKEIKELKSLVYEAAECLNYYGNRMDLGGTARRMIKKIKDAEI